MGRLGPSTSAPAGGRAAVAGLFVLALAAPAYAESSATLAVELDPAGVPGWQAEAVAGAIAADLAGDRLRASEVERPACPTGDDGCAIAHYRAAGVDIALVGQLSDERLTYRLLLTWPGASAAVQRGEVELRGRAALAQHLREALYRVTRPGGALERRDRPGAIASPAAVGAPQVGAEVLAALALAALFLLLPFGLALGLPGLRSLGRTMTAIAALAVIGGALVALGDRVPAASWLILVTGGVAWGTFAAVTLPIVFPPLSGLSRVDHLDLFRVIGSWLRLAVQRAVEVALLHAPLAALLVAVCAWLEVPALVALAVVAPLAGLLFRLWLHSLVEVLSRRLDAVLVDGVATAHNPWDAAIRGYLLGYLRRLGWEGDERALETVLFLPGIGEEALVYGGGATGVRVVVPRVWLELALAPYGRPHDYAAPLVSTLHWTEWNAGLVVPTELFVPVATPEQRRPREEPVAGGEIDHEPLGEPPTLAGIVEPSQLDERGAHRPWEDPLWLQWHPGEEHDGTDPSDRDFLFGLLIHALGRGQRRESLPATVAIAWHRWLNVPWPWPRAFAAARALASRIPIRLADASAALVARHHLVQYLAWRAWRRDDLLTARANTPELERQSVVILRALETEARPESREAHALRRRLRWMIPFVRSPSGRRRPPWRRPAVAVALLAALTAGALATARAIDYHPTYIQRTSEARQRSTDERPDPDGTHE
jgi:hypothetical protein